MSTRPRRRFLALTAAALLTSGCFKYVPADFEGVAPGESVRVYLSRQGLADLEQLDVENGPIVRGTLMEQDASRVVLRVPLTRVQEGFHSASLGQDVIIPLPSIVQIERRRPNPTGTALLVAGTAAAAAAVIYLIVKGGGGEDEPDPGSPPEIRIPLLSIPVP